MQSGHIDQFKHLSQFTDLKQFNSHFGQWMIDAKDQFTKSEYLALKRLVRYSAKVAGVCNAKIQTIVSATHKDGEIGISRSTFKRMLTKAVNLGLLTIHNTFKHGKQSHSVYVFNPYVSSQIETEPPKKEKLNQHKTINLSKSINIKNNKRIDMLNAEFTSQRVPIQFKNLVAYVFNDAMIIEQLWSKVRISAYKNCFEDNEDIMLNVALEAFKATVRALKVKQVRDMYGYFYGVLERKFSEYYFEELFDLGFAV